MLDYLALAGAGLVTMYLVGLVTWQLMTFLYADYWSWHQVGLGFIWPWLWWKALRRRS